MRRKMRKRKRRVGVMKPFSSSRQLSGLNGLILDSSLVFALVEFVIVVLIAPLLFAAPFIREYSKQILCKHNKAGLIQFRSQYAETGLTQSGTFCFARFQPNGEML